MTLTWIQDGTPVTADSVNTPLSELLAIIAAGFGIREIIRYESSGTFSKADYPWLRGILAFVVGAGGGSAGVDVSLPSGAGGAGLTAISLILDILGLPSTVGITIGAGGLGSVPGVVGGDGGASSFGSIVSANGGLGGGTSASYPGGLGATVGIGQILIPGGSGDNGERYVTGLSGGNGGSSLFGAGGRGSPALQAGSVGGIGTGFGAGAGASFGGQPSNPQARNGNNGTGGLVMLGLLA